MKISQFNTRLRMVSLKPIRPLSSFSAVRFSLRTLPCIAPRSRRQSLGCRHRERVVISLSMGIPVKYSVCRSAQTVNSVTTSPDPNTSLPAIPLARAMVSRISSSNSF